jgi:hypothetical protein
VVMSLQWSLVSTMAPQAPWLQFCAPTMSEWGWSVSPQHVTPAPSPLAPLQRPLLLAPDTTDLLPDCCDCGITACLHTSEKQNLITNHLHYPRDMGEREEQGRGGVSQEKVADTPPGGG